MKPEQIAEYNRLIENNLFSNFQAKLKETKETPEIDLKQLVEATEEETDKLRNLAEKLANLAVELEGRIEQAGDAESYGRLNSALKRCKPVVEKLNKLLSELK